MQINDNRYYFSDGIVSLPFAHPYLKSISERKQKQKTKDRKILKERKEQLNEGRKRDRFEERGVVAAEKYFITEPYISILKFYKKKNGKQRKHKLLQTSRSYILGSCWK